jgi:hypothetical protein
VPAKFLLLALLATTGVIVLIEVLARAVRELG